MSWISIQPDPQSAKMMESGSAFRKIMDPDPHFVKMMDPDPHIQLN
jgi:hypothetical protein